MKMRHAFLCLLPLGVAPALYAQEDPQPQQVQDAPEPREVDNEFAALELASGGAVVSSATTLPEVDSIGTRFAQLFDSEDAQRDFRRLREFRSKKQSELEAARLRNTELRHAEEKLQASMRDRAVIAGMLQRALTAAGAGDTLYIKESLPGEYDDMLGVTTPGEVTRDGVVALREWIAEQDSAARPDVVALDSALARQGQNIRYLEEDIRQAEAAIDVALAPEYQSQKFRKAVSAFFAGLIAVMILSFFATIYMKAGNGVGTLLLSDSGLQFVTIFVLIIAIILFGILNILAGRELAAILSGIAGYILGRGAQAAPGAAAANAPPPQPAAPAPEPPPSSIRVPGLFLPPAPPERAPAAQTPQAESPAAPPAEKPAPAAVG